MRVLTRAEREQRDEIERVYPQARLAREHGEAAARHGRFANLDRPGIRAVAYLEERRTYAAACRALEAHPEYGGVLHCAPARPIRIEQRRGS